VCRNRLGRTSSTLPEFAELPRVVLVVRKGHSFSSARLGRKTEAAPTSNESRIRVQIAENRLHRGLKSPGDGRGVGHRAPGAQKPSMYLHGFITVCLSCAALSKQKKKSGRAAALSLARERFRCAT